MKMRQFTSKYRCLSPKNTTDPDSKILIQTLMIQIQKSIFNPKAFNSLKRKT